MTAFITQSGMKPGDLRAAQPGADLPTSAAFEAITHASERLGWPLTYTDDVTLHDRATLADNPGLFIWLLRPAGTRLIRYGTPQAASLLEYDLRPGQTTRGYLYRGALIPATADALLAALADLPAAYSVTRGQAFTDGPVTAVITREHVTGTTVRTVRADALARFGVTVDQPEPDAPYWDSRAYHQRNRHLDEAWNRLTGL